MGLKKIVFVLVVIFIVFTACVDKTDPQATIIFKYSSECGSCSLMKPVVRGLEREFKGLVALREYDIEKPKEFEIVRKYETKIVPAIIMLDKEGVVFFKIEGTIDKKTLVDALRKNGIGTKPKSDK